MIAKNRIARLALGASLVLAASAAIIRPAVAVTDERFAAYPEQSGEPETPPDLDGAGPRSAERLLSEGEAAYGRAQWSVAMERFRALLSIDPEHAHALFRLGNLHQRRGQWLSSASFYRKAARRLEAMPDGQAMRAKALLNLAAVNFELALASLGELADIPGAPSPSAEIEALRASLRGWLSQATAAREATRVTTASARSAGAPSGAGGPSGTRRSEATSAQPATIIGRPETRTARPDPRAESRSDARQDARPDERPDSRMAPRPDSRPDSVSSPRLPAVEYLRPADSR